MASRIKNLLKSDRGILLVSTFMFIMKPVIFFNTFMDVLREKFSR